MHHNNSKQLTRIQEIVDSVFKAHPETKGIAVHIEVPKYDLSWKGAVGFADSKGRKLTPEMPANIASNTKTYVAAAMLRLIEQGKLKTTEPIAKIISDKSNRLLIRGGYNTEQITVAHLLTNTSGIFDFVNTQQYQNLTQSDPGHRWTRDEQIQLAIDSGLFTVKAGEQFAYSETNYLLLTEIIEQKTQLPFHLAVRTLLKFEKLKLNSTWFLLQEDYPKGVLPLVEQTATAYNVNSYRLDYSFDAFGGGGLASTVTDLARFSQYLFSGNIFEKQSTQELLYTTIATTDGLAPSYSFGLMHTNVAGYKAFGHGGFWGTQVKYIPEVDLTIAVFVMERDTWPVYNILIEEVVREIVKQKTLQLPGNTH
ncbi:MAG: serine hydrolase domain-containing protein [Bacteroidota bacterium]